MSSDIGSFSYVPLWKCSTRKKLGVLRLIEEYSFRSVVYIAGYIFPQIPSSIPHIFRQI